MPTRLNGNWLLGLLRPRLKSSAHVGVPRPRKRSVRELCPPVIGRPCVLRCCSPASHLRLMEGHQDADWCRGHLDAVWWRRSTGLHGLRLPSVLHRPAAPAPGHESACSWTASARLETCGSRSRRCCVCWLVQRRRSWTHRRRCAAKTRQADAAC